MPLGSEDGRDEEMRHTQDSRKARVSWRCHSHQLGKMMDNFSQFSPRKKGGSSSESEKDSSSESESGSGDERELSIKPKNFDWQVIFVVDDDNVSSNHGVRLYQKYEDYSGLFNWYGYARLVPVMGSKYMPLFTPKLRVYLCGHGDESC